MHVIKHLHNTNFNNKEDIIMAEYGTIRIPDYEYKERIQRAAKLIQKEGLDVLIVNSNEADYANAR